MGLLTKKALDSVSSLPNRKNLKDSFKSLMKYKTKKAARPEQNRQQVNKDEGTSNNDSQATVSTRKDSLQTPRGVGVMNMGHGPPSRIHSSCLTLSEGMCQKSLNLSSEETEQSLLKGTFSTRCVVSSSESIEETWFDIYQGKQMKQKMSGAQFKLFYFNNNDTRFVDGLLTTTLCSTEL